MKVWHPKNIRAYGGKIISVTQEAAAEAQGEQVNAFRAWLSFLVLLVVVAIWTAPWSSLGKVSWSKVRTTAMAISSSSAPYSGCTIHWSLPLG